MQNVETLILPPAAAVEAPEAATIRAGYSSVIGPLLFLLFIFGMGTAFINAGKNVPADMSIQISAVLTHVPTVILLFFIGLPMLFLINGLFVLRVKLCIDSKGITQQGKLSRWHYDWEEISAWEHHKGRNRGPDLMSIDLIIKPNNTKVKISRELIRYRNKKHDLVYRMLLNRLGAPANVPLYYQVQLYP